MACLDFFCLEKCFFQNTFFGEGGGGGGGVLALFSDLMLTTTNVSCVICQLHKLKKTLQHQVILQNKTQYMDIY